MKILRVLLLVLCILTMAGVEVEAKRIRSHSRANGHHVKSHHRTKANHTKRDNYSAKGNRNPYTGKQGTKSPKRRHSKAS